jgi:hypothetical protein
VSEFDDNRPRATGSCECARAHTPRPVPERGCYFPARYPLSPLNLTACERVHTIGSCFVFS